jgi:uncharacterized protein YodC (DUF2158 family)
MANSISPDLLFSNHRVSVETPISGLKCNLVALLKRGIMSDAQSEELYMTIASKRASIVTAAIIGILLGVPLSVPSFADPVSSHPVLPTQAPASFQQGDLVRLRSGGPAMTVSSIKGNQVYCFWTGEDGQPNAEHFPIDVLQDF